MIKLERGTHYAGNGRYTVTVSSTELCEAQFFEALFSRSAGLEIFRNFPDKVVMKKVVRDSTPYNKRLATKFLQERADTIGRNHVVFKILPDKRMVIATGSINGITGEAKCSPNDTFDAEVGMTIALARFFAKKYNNSVKENLPNGWEW